MGSTGSALLFYTSAAGDGKHGCNNNIEDTGESHVVLWHDLLLPLWLLRLRLLEPMLVLLWLLSFLQWLLWLLHSFL